MLDREGLAGEHRVDRRMRLGDRRGDDDAFPRGQAVGLDDDRRPALVDVGMGLACVVEAAEASRGNAVTGHECLGEMLGALELRCRACRPEDPQARGAKRVDDAGG